MESIECAMYGFFLPFLGFVALGYIAGMGFSIAGLFREVSSVGGIGEVVFNAIFFLIAAVILLFVVLLYNVHQERSPHIWTFIISMFLGIYCGFYFMLNSVKRAIGAVIGRSD